MLQYLQTVVWGYDMYIIKTKIADATPGMMLAESVYFPTGAGFSLFARKGTELDENTIKKLHKNSIETIEVFSKDPPTVEQIEYIEPVEELFDEQLKEEAVDSVKQLFSCANVEGGLNKTTAYQCVSNLESVVGDLLEVITDNATGIFHINDLKAYDEYTYHHSLSVSVLSMATGRELGMDSDTLFRLGRCAMMHDFGKQMVPIDIINKAGKLTNEEFEIVKSHPALGANSFRDNDVGDDELWNGILYHHEKINGSGYHKLQGKEIPIFSKIIAAADVYDAITSYRSYRLPMQPLKAFDIIFKDIGTVFDYEITKAFYKKLEFYPVNSIVELSDGRIAIVVENGNFKLRPAVRIWGGNNVINLASSAHNDINIVRTMTRTDLPEGYEIENA
jgi:HD-GYP domain-containing protein (c-di-GMP phosphodiesterase class II)